MKKLGLSTFDYKLDYTVFDSIDTEEKAYWLGFMYADGWVTSNRPAIGLGLKEEDSYHLEKFVRFFKLRKVKITHTLTKLNGKSYPQCKWSLQNSHVYNRLIELGCIPNKSLMLKFPDKSIFKEESLVYFFIRGYTDGDGCLWFNKSNKINLEIIGTKEFLEGIMIYFPNKFSFGHKDKRHLSSNTYKLISCGNNAIEVVTKLYKNSNIHLERKYLRYKIAVS